MVMGVEKGMDLINRLERVEGLIIVEKTNGSLDIGCVDDRCIKIVDMKCPSSGEDRQNDLKNLNRLTPGDQVKFVIGYEDVQRLGLAGRAGNLGDFFTGCNDHNPMALEQVCNFFSYSGSFQEAHAGHGKPALSLFAIPTRYQYI